MTRRRRLLLMMDSMSIHSWSLRTNTPVTWATESVTTSPSLQPSVWRWEQTHCGMLGLCFALLCLIPPLNWVFAKTLSLFSCLSRSWGSALTHHWCTYLPWVCGAPTRMHFLTTPSKRTSCPPHGTGLACTRYWDRHRGKTNKQYTVIEDGFDLMGLFSHRWDSRVRPIMKPLFGSERMSCQRQMKLYR